MNLEQAIKPEHHIHSKLEEAWANFSKLSNMKESDLMEFRSAIRHAQQVLLIRCTRDALERCLFRSDKMP